MAAARPLVTIKFSFKLYDALAAGVQVGSTQTQILTVVDGLFTATPSFGNVFNGAALYLEIGVRPSGSPDPFTTLSPRQALSADPLCPHLAPRRQRGGQHGRRCHLVVA